MTRRITIEVGIRGEARSAVYRAALRPGHNYCFGFLLGRTRPIETPSIEFALVSATVPKIDGLWHAPDIIRAQFSACERIADETGTEPFGLFAAWDFNPGEPANQLLGLWLDTANEMKLEYVVIFPTMGHESIWGAICYRIAWFPDAPLACRTLCGKLSLDPRHNPRRVRSRWNQLLAGSVK